MSRRKLALGLAAGLTAMLLYLGWNTMIAAAVGAAAMAKVTCSCVFVEQRTLEACRSDDPPGFEGIDVRIDEAGQTATASVMGLLRRRAVYSPSYGCTLEP
jgi:hypothetical protein